MKKLLFLFLLCTSLHAMCQEIKRDNISGKIIIEGDDIEGIAVTNITSGLGTVTNENGEFIISVALNDLIKIRGLKYQNIDVTINEIILDSKKLSVFLIEEINKLDEIVVKSKKLSGNLKVDMDRAAVFNTKSNAIYFGIKNKDIISSLENANINNDKITTIPAVGTLVDGLNIVNIVDQLLIPLFRSEVNNKKDAGVPEVPAKSIKFYFGSTFLNENFNIPKHRVEEFIRYVEDEESFDYDLLNYGHEIEFLELLSKKSKAFLQTNSKSN